MLYVMTKRPDPQINLSDALVNRLLAIPGVEERRSRWQDSGGLSYRGKEFLHFDRADLVDIRLGPSLTCDTSAKGCQIAG